MNTSNAALLYHFESKARLVALCAWKLGDACAASLRDRVGPRGWDGFIPERDDMAGIRARLALAEIGRTDEVVAAAVEATRVQEEREIRYLLSTAGWEVAEKDPRVEIMSAALIGLWEGVCIASVTPAGARAAWSFLRNLLFGSSSRSSRAEEGPSQDAKSR